MVRLHAHELLDTVHALLTQMYLGRATEGPPLLMLDAHLEDMRRHAEALGLVSTIREIDALVTVLDRLGERAEWIEAERGVSLICRRVSEELTSRLVLVGNEEAAELWEAERPLGVAVAAAFPGADIDLREAARCFALDRWTAAVFHSMRAVEVVLRELGKRYNVEPENPNWGQILGRIDRMIRSLDEVSGRSAAEITLILHHLKHLWRNPVSHAGTHFTKEEATRAWHHTRELFRAAGEHLAAPSGRG